MVATVLTVYGIETAIAAKIAIVLFVVVATALTVYGMRRRVRGSRGAMRR